MLCCLSAMTIMMSHSGGRGTQFNEGNTGAPGDDNKTCATCHNGGNFGTDIQITLKDVDGNQVSEYKGGETYTVSAVINTSTNPAGYGLQMVAIDNVNEANAGALSDPSGNAQIANTNNRMYLEQAGLSSVSEFSATWEAPTGAGAVTFYATGHAADGNGQSSGDEAQSVSMEFGENVVESTVEFKDNLFSINPNPVSNFTTITLDRTIDAVVNIHSASGQVLLSNTIQSKELTVDLTDFPQGTYSVTVTDSESKIVSTKQLIKI